MSDATLEQHWQRVYLERDSSKVSWFEDSPVASLERGWERRLSVA